MLRIRQGQIRLIDLQAEAEHDVVGAEVAPGEVVVIEVLPDAVKLPRRQRQTHAKLGQGQALKRLGQRLIFLHAPAGHKPEALRRTVSALAEQKLAARVLHDQIDGD